ncbi:MAG: HSP70 family protein [Okeania sp. SIO3B5]|uniref:Hsp70 family protein n=1 Tax=Okeania sp. SIO3B5 TaxID=2607811 RepID=UPI0014019794|nr:Hsp70 family protein [Okeania sp. SIO3B5]NEO54685.1 HSP70 family protein [Okeania sp. SIO3B5]
MVNVFRDRNYRIAIAIDFGTARSGYAYIFMEDKDAKEPSFRNKWPHTNEFYPKTLTEILFNPDGIVEAWGHNAKKRFTQLRETQEEKDYIFIDNFKTLLHEGKDRDDDGPYIMREGKKFSILNLIAEFLKLVKETALEDIAEGLGGEGLLDESEIRWCLTVPAVWTDESKQIMRRAAQEAGLIGEGTEEAERLLLVLEPEAAAVHCQQVMLGRNESAPLVGGKTIMIVDAGGGTVDITVHEVVKDRGLDELIPPGGGLHGSKYVDQSFREFLDRKLSAEAMNEFQSEWPVEYAKLMGETWESIKCGYDADSNWRTSIELPRKLEKILKDKYPQILEQLANAQGGDDTVIRLTNKDMEAIFKPIVDELIARIREQFTALQRKCDILFLVGGFAESPLLKKRIREEFKGKVEKIVIPDRPGAAVLLGAASFGVNPGVIIARRSRLTYGKGCAAPFQNGIDPEEKRIPKELLSRVYQQEEDRDYCDGRFDIFVAAGDRVPTDAIVKRKYQIIPNQTEIETTFLSTSNPKVRYTDEEGVSEIASVEIRLPFEAKENTKKYIEVEMQFGLSEVVAYAIDPISGNRERCNFRFACNY